MTASPARITVSRKDRRDIRDRQIVVSLDGTPFGTLLFGEAATHEVSPGPHRLRAHNTLFWKTMDIEVQPGEHVELVAVNRAGFGTFSLLGLLGAAPLYLTFERAPAGG
ncbi:MAG: hypothetical protein ACRD1U_12910 [Vicinamibacterales bacterium]